VEDLTNTDGAVEDDSRDQGLLAALGIQERSGLVSIVGGGGKSTLMFALGSALPGPVVLTTTTRIFAAQTALAPRWCSLDEDGWESRIGNSSDPLLVVGSVEGERAVGVPRELPGALVARETARWVVVEADGSRMLPVKAPADHEPVVPEETSLLVVVAGIDALARPIAEVAHRPERVCEVTGLDASDRLDPAALARLLTSERGGLKAAPSGARCVVFLNKVETDEEFLLAARVAEAAADVGVADRVVAGALARGVESGFTSWPGRNSETHGADGRAC
jgi:molybdenum cofactor cytidylyltransferase